MLLPNVVPNLKMLEMLEMFVRVVHQDIELHVEGVYSAIQYKLNCNCTTNGFKMKVMMCPFSLQVVRDDVSKKKMMVLKMLWPLLSFAFTFAQRTICPISPNHLLT